MSLYCFRHIRYAYNTEFGESEVGDKCHQLIFLIRCINQDPARTFYLFPNSDFDEGVISARSRLCCVQKYNKDKIDKLIIDIFVMANRK